MSNGGQKIVAEDCQTAAIPCCVGCGLPCCQHANLAGLVAARLGGVTAWQLHCCCAWSTWQCSSRACQDYTSGRFRGVLFACLLADSLTALQLGGTGQNLVAHGPFDSAADTGAAHSLDGVPLLVLCFVRSVLAGLAAALLGELRCKVTAVAHGPLGSAEVMLVTMPCH
jgi:hypothetical protein